MTRARHVLLAPVLCLVLGGCTGDGAAPGRSPEQTVPDRPIADVLQEVSPEWMAIEGVVMTYQGALEDGSPCIKVGVVELTPELRARIPDTAGGYPVVVVETGPVAPR